MKILVILLVVSILGNMLGVVVLYKYLQKDKALQAARMSIASKEKILDQVNRQNDRRLVFIHHSVGRNWLSEGDLRDSLFSRGFAIRSVTRGFALGDETDMQHWVPKFESDLDQIIHFDQPHVALPNGEENDIIMFKSCFPNSDIVADGMGEGDPLSAERTLTNYRAIMNRLETVMADRPGKTFIYVTAPPLAAEKTNPEIAARARSFNTWVVNEFLPMYTERTGQNNLLVFDLFDLLADSDSHTLRPEYQRRENDSHPNPAGSKAATAAFLLFLDQHQDQLAMAGNN